MPMLDFLRKRGIRTGPSDLSGTRVADGSDALNKMLAARADFPILAGSKPIIYADSACVSLRPRPVVDAIASYYTRFPVCAGRSNHRLSRELDLALRAARDDVAHFVGVKHADEIIFTKNATESINLVANALAFEEGDIVLTSHKEHNSNLIPWLRLAQSGRIIHKVIPPDASGNFSPDALQRELDAAKKEGKRVRLVAVQHVSNVDGTSIDVTEVAKRAHWYGASVLVDGCQAVGHMPVDVKAIGADFYVFSAHKMLGPSGMGALYASREAQKELAQFIVGGSTVSRSTYTAYTPADGPSRFEAGLQDYAGVLGFAAACVYLRKAGLEQIQVHTARLNRLLTDLLAEEIAKKNIVVLGGDDPAKRGSIFSFTASVMPATEFSSMLDKTYGIAVRAGQHCVHSYFDAIKTEGSVRVSLHLYNTEDEIRNIAQAIRSLLRIHGGA